MKKIQEILTRIEKDLQQVPLSDAELAQLKRPFLIAKNDELAPDDASAWRTAIERLIKNRESLVGWPKGINIENYLYMASQNDEPILISKETFEAVQIEKGRRSSIVKEENGSKRKNEKYSSKKK